MKRINIIVLIIIIFNITLLQAYDWPIKEDTTQHIITSVMGECRSKYQGKIWGQAPFFPKLFFSLPLLS
jgi:hypothetical protein